MTPRMGSHAEFEASHQFGFQRFLLVCEFPFLIADNFLILYYMLQK